MANLASSRKSSEKNTQKTVKGRGPPFPTLLGKVLASSSSNGSSSLRSFLTFLRLLKAKAGLLAPRNDLSFQFSKGMKCRRSSPCGLRGRKDADFLSDKAYVEFWQSIVLHTTVQHLLAAPSQAKVTEFAHIIVTIKRLVPGCATTAKFPKFESQHHGTVSLMYCSNVSLKVQLMNRRRRM